MDGGPHGGGSFVIVNVRTVNLAERVLRHPFPELGIAVEKRPPLIQRRTDMELVQKIAEVPAGQKTSNLAAQMAGFGNRETHQQAKNVVAHANETASIVQVNESLIIR